MALVPTAARVALTAFAQHAQQPQQLRTVVSSEASKDNLGTVATGPRQAVLEAPPRRGEFDQHGAPIVRIGTSYDQSGRLHPVHHGRHRTGHHLELGGDVGHAGRLTGARHDAQQLGLAVGEAEGGELLRGTTAEPASGVRQQLGQLRGDIGRGVVDVRGGGSSDHAAGLHFRGIR